MRVDGCLSLPQAPESCIPQGTVLGPILFLVYINDLPRSIPSDHEASIFADDTSMFKIGGSVQKNFFCTLPLVQDLSRATDWATVWGMQFKAEKSEHLIMSTKRKIPASNML